MTIEEKIKADFIAAYKAKESTVADTLRLLGSALKNRAIEKKGAGNGDALTDEETLDTIRKEAKKRRDSIALYETGGRADLAAHEAAELAVLETYLPAMMPEAEVEKIVDGVIAAHGPFTPKEFGKAMGFAMAELKGKAEPATITKALKAKIG